MGGHRSSKYSKAKPLTNAANALEKFSHYMSLVEVSPTKSLDSAASAELETNLGKRNVVVLKNRSEGGFGPEQTVYLVGTAHVSTKSCEDVRDLIQAVKPQVGRFRMQVE